MKKEDYPIAVVMGDIDLLRPLGLAKIPCAIVADRGALPRYSRYAKYVIEWTDPWNEIEQSLEKLIDFAKGQKTKPILFYESDADLLLVSRYRSELGRYYRFVVPDEQLTEDLVDKLRFQNLAEKLSLPVPKSEILEANSKKTNLVFPLIAKPLTRKTNEWSPIAGLSKAIRIETPEELDKFKERFGESGIRILAQELIEGEESAIESYHVYVDEDGEIAGEFAGKKIRTYPKHFGQSCALTITDSADVLALGRELVEKLNLHGLAKFDFKRSPEGKLFLLEVNPRFSLWHHPGALAGVNLPQLVYCDLVGLPRPEFGKARAGTNWCRLWQDVFSARAEGVSFFKWFSWAIKCEAKPGLSLDDPLPIFGAAFWRIYYKLTPKVFQGNHTRLRAKNSGIG